jgi:hypothetical protein
MVLRLKEHDLEEHESMHVLLITKSKIVIMFFTLALISHVPISNMFSNIL